MKRVIQAASGTGDVQSTIKAIKSDFSDIMLDLDQLSNMSNKESAVKKCLSDLTKCIDSVARTCAKEIQNS